VCPAVAVVDGSRGSSSRGPAINVCMALTPDAVFLSPPLATADSTADAGLAEGLAALESYKKKDPAKGQFQPSLPQDRVG
jgi:hypothetical protein